MNLRVPDTGPRIAARLGDDWWRGAVIYQVYPRSFQDSDAGPLGFAGGGASRDNPKAGWYVWADAKPDGTPPNNWLSIFGGSAWQWDTRRCQYYFHNFLVEQPDLNFHTVAVQEALLDA